VPVAEGLTTAGEECEGLTGVATQLPRSSEPHGFQKEKRQQLAAPRPRLTVGQTQYWSSSQEAGLKGCLKLREQTPLMGSRQHQETACPFLPFCGVGGRDFLYLRFFPCSWCCKWLLTASAARTRLIWLILTLT
jgi:hypothetical protein